MLCAFVMDLLGRDNTCALASPHRGKTTGLCLVEKIWIDALIYSIIF